MAVLSRPVFQTISTSCIEYVHPWCTSCHEATFDLLLHAFFQSLRTYATVYLFTLIMRRKNLTRKVIRETVLGILQSTVFLTTHAFGFPFLICTLRRLTGRFDKYSVSFLPCFLSSIMAINLERASRRPILCLYVTNLATETLFRMAVWRGWIKPVKFGEIIIFTLSTTALLYFFRSDSSTKDSIFSLMRYVVGPYEQAMSPQRRLEMDSPPLPRRRKNTSSGSGENYSMYVIIANIYRSYSRMIDLIRLQPRSPFCPHPLSCFSYALQGLGKMVAVGYGIKLVLRLVFSAKEIIRKPSRLPQTFFGGNVLNLGSFLGLFCFLFRVMTKDQGSSCGLRWIRGFDSELHAIPAGLISGLAFLFYPDTTAALYIMWKAFQIIYGKLVKAGYLPNIPHGTVILYCFSTAVLFHAALLEPQNLRPSYYKFLHGLSGGRIAVMDRKCLDAFGLNTSEHHADVMNKLKLDYKIVQSFLMPKKWK